MQCLRSSVRGREQIEGAWTQSIHSVAPTSLDCLARVEQTRGVVPNMLVSRGRSSFRSYSHLRRYKQSHLKSSWRCVFIRFHHNADGVRLRTHFYHDWNTSPTRGHRPPRERCRRDISQQTHARPLLPLRNVVRRALWIPCKPRWTVLELVHMVEGSTCLCLKPMWTNPGS